MYGADESTGKLARESWPHGGVIGEHVQGYPLIIGPHETAVHPVHVPRVGVAGRRAIMSGTVFLNWSNVKYLLWEVTVE